MGDYLRRMLEMANLPIPEDVQQAAETKEREEREEAARQAKAAEAKAKAKAASAAQAAKAAKAAAAAAARKEQEVAAAAATDSMAVGTVQQMPMMFQQTGFPTAGVGSEMGALAMASPMQFGAAMCDPAAFGGMCGGCGAAGMPMGMCGGCGGCGGCGAPGMCGGCGACGAGMCGGCRMAGGMVPGAEFGACGVPGGAMQFPSANFAAMQFQNPFAMGGAMMGNPAVAAQRAVASGGSGGAHGGLHGGGGGAGGGAAEANGSGGGGAGGGASAGDSRPAERRPPEKLRRSQREPHDPNRRFIGTITKWDDDAGFGFISSWDAYKVYGKDVFVHKAQIGLTGDASAMYAKRKRSEIRNGDTVSYTVDLAENPGKPRAYNVEKLPAPPEGPPVGAEPEPPPPRRRRHF